MTSISYLLSKGADAGGTVGSTGNKLHHGIEIDGARDLLSLHGQPIHKFGKDKETTEERIREFL